MGKHECGNKTSYTAWGIPITETTGCKCKHKESLADHKKNCCKANTKWIKSAPSDSKTQPTFEICKNTCSPINNTILSLFHLPLNKERHSFEITHSPPIPDFPIFLKNRILLI